MSNGTQAIMPLTVTQTIKAILASFILMALSACDDIEKKPTIDAEGVIIRAESYLKQGQYRAASIEAKNALQQDPNNLKAHIILARIVLELGQPKAAIAQLEQVKNANDPDYVLTLSEAYIKRHKYFSANELLNNNKAATSKHNPFQYKLLLAQAKYGLGEIDQAKKLYEEILSIAAGDNSKQVTAYVEYAKFAAANDDFTKAHSLLDKALAIETSPEALVQKGILEFQSGNLDKAEDHLSNALIELKTTDIITPLRVQVLKGLIETLTQSGRSSEALIYSKLLAEAAPSAEEDKSKFNEAIKLYKAGELEKAEELLSEIYQNGGNEFSGRMLGLINAMQGDLAEADSFLSEHVDPETASSKAVRILAETKLKLQQTEEALEILAEKVSQSPNDPEILSIYGLALLSAGQVDKATEVITKTLSIDPSKLKLKVALANIYYNKGEPEKALSLLQEAYQQDSNDHQVLTALSKLYIVNKQPQKARELSNSLLAKAPNDAFSHSLAGAVEFSTGNYDKAIQFYLKANEIEPDKDATLLALGRSYIGAKQLDNALNIFDKLLKNAPNSPTVIKAAIAAHELNNSVANGISQLESMAENNIQLWAPYAVLAEYYLRNNNTENALNYIEKALERNALDSYPVRVALTTYHNAASQAIRSSNYSDARNYLMAGLQLKPNDLKFLSMLTSVEIRSDQLREAQKLLSQLEAVQPNSSIVTELKGDMAFKEGDLSKALTLYEQAWSEEPNDSLGNKIYRIRGKLNQNQISFLNEWITSIPKSENALLVKAVEAQKNQQIDKAIGFYKKALDINPKSLAALNNLAWLKFEQKMDGALEMAEKGAQLYPKNAAMLDTYGWILFNQGQKEKAQEVLKLAHQLAPDNKEIEQHYNKVK